MYMHTHRGYTHTEATHTHTQATHAQITERIAWLPGL